MLVILQRRFTVSIEQDRRKLLTLNAIFSGVQDGSIELNYMFLCIEGLDIQELTILDLIVNTIGRVHVVTSYNFCIYSEFCMLDSQLLTR